MAYEDVNGLRMYYEVHGDGQPLLLLHPGTLSTDFFSEDIPFFATDFQVIAIDQMGHGRTADIPNREFHFHDMAVATTELMRQLGIERAAIVGGSDGGIVGLHMAIHDAKRVTRLAITGSNSDTDGYTEEFLEWVRAADPDDLPVSDEYARESPDGADHWPVVIGRLKRMWATEPNFTYDQLQGIDVPTLIIIGDEDVVTPEHAVKMFRSIPKAQLCVVPHAGHCIMPNETILAFLQEPDSE